MEDRCICCGEIIPEGRMVCYACEQDPMRMAKKEAKTADHSAIAEKPSVLYGNPGNGMSFSAVLKRIVKSRPSNLNSGIIRTVIAIDYGSRNPRHLTLNFLIPNKEFDLFAAIKAAATEYCQTEDGKKTYIGNCHCFNWGDFDLHVPQDICKKHGFQKIDALVADSEVNFDEDLVNEDDVIKEEEDEE